MANVKYVNKQEVLDLIIGRIEEMNDLGNPNISHETQDAIRSALSDLQYDVESLLGKDITTPEAEWIFTRTIKNGLDAAMPPVCTNCRTTDANASRHAFCPNCGYKMKPPRFVGYLKGIK